MSTAVDKRTVPLIDRIEAVVADIPGWSPVDQLYTLFCLVYLDPEAEGDIIEIGSWCGRSSVVLGMAARMTGAARVYCIDLFPEKDDWRENDDGTYSFEVVLDGRRYAGHNVQTVWREPFQRDIAPVYERYNSVFDRFIKSVEDNDLQDIVRPCRGTSEMIRDFVPEGFRCRLAFIDGEHSYEAVCRDITNVEPFLVEGGWLCFDDAFTTYSGVNRAIEDLVLDNPGYELCRQMTRKLFVARRRRG